VVWFICTCEAHGEDNPNYIDDCLLSVPGVPRDRHPDSWDNLYQLVAGQAVEVKESNVKLEKGIFVGFADQSLTIHTQQQNLVSPRTQISEIRLRPRRAGRNTWIGAGVEAAAGLGIGAGIGAGLSHDSGGDLANLQPVVIGVTAGVAALGSVLGNLPQHCLQGTLIHK
jgi:hypothetical protein